jgi:HTH-type transcriptional regulator / antitoxin HigA
MKDVLPARPRSPGSVLKRELDARGWSQKDFAEILGRPVQVITEIVRGTKQVTPDTALELASALGTPPRLWTDLETEYRLGLAHARRSAGTEIERRAKIFYRLPVSELIRRGWIKGSRQVDELEQQVFAFLGVRTLEEEPELSVSYRRSADSDDVAASQRAWVRRVEILAEKGNIKGKFSPQRLHGAIPTIRNLAGRLEDVAEVPAALAECGVRFVIVRHLPKTKIDGAAMYLRSGPVIALTLRFDRIDWFWFTLMHEIAHLALGHQQGHLDFLGDSDATTASASSHADSDEREADDLASDALISTSSIRRLARSTRGPISKAAVEAFAREHRLHPGIVVGRMHHMGFVPYSHMRGYLEKVSHLLEPWIDG